MESNHGNLCCQCVSGRHLEKCLPLLGLLMVYDRTECWGKCASPSFPVALWWPHTLKVMFSPWNRCCVFRDRRRGSRRGPSFRSGPHLSPSGQRTQVIAIKVRKSLFVSLFVFLPASSCVCSTLPLPVLKKTFQNTLPYAAQTPDLIHQAC